MLNPTLPKLETLHQKIPLEGIISIAIIDGITIFRASEKTQNRIETLLDKQQKNCLSNEETTELDAYEELDDYLSLVNRTIRNFYLTQN
jgi:type IV secretory pathway VirB4 component